VDIREVRPDEHEKLGELTVVAYGSVPGYAPEPDYELELRDVATRAVAPATAVIVAVDDDGTLLGGVTYVASPESPFAEHDAADAAGIRMLAVDPSGQGRGVGEALTVACIERARAEGRAALVLHSTTYMTTAHRLYGRLGFGRAPDLDWEPIPGLVLLGFRLPLGELATPVARR
jgi:GNAT superfamily N-acetyltransferase